MLRSGVVRAVGASLLFALAGVQGDAGVIAVAPASPNSAAAERDLVLTIQARRALLRDPELGPLNLGVRIRNRVATLWGPVPTAELSFKAELCVRGVFELREVRNELCVSGVNLPARAAGLPPPAFLPAPPAPALPGLPAVTVPPPLPVPVAPAVLAPPVQDEIELPPLRLPQAK